MVRIEKALLSQVVGIAKLAGAEVMALYKQTNLLDIDKKADASPITKADLLADQLIRNKLLALVPQLPVLSEETPVPAFDKRKLWRQYWLVDPLDGTRGFVRGGREFTVNIALVDGGEAVLGVVFAPALKRCFAAAVGLGAFVVEENAWQSIATRKLNKAPGEMLVLNSSRQTGGEYQKLLDRFAIQGFDVQQKQVSSSFKLCLLAEGGGDITPCFVPTCEWDTAAAQVVVEQAGGLFLDAQSMSKLTYNQKDSLLNPSFYALADAGADWPLLL